MIKEKSRNLLEKNKVFQKISFNFWTGWNTDKVRIDNEWYEF